MAGGVYLHKCLSLIVKWLCRGQWVATSGRYKKFYKVRGKSLSQVYIKAKAQGIKDFIVFYVPTKEEERKRTF